jgi:hypothetical protein
LQKKRQQNVIAAQQACQAESFAKNPHPDDFIFRSCAKFPEKGHQSRPKLATINCLSVVAKSTWLVLWVIDFDWALERISMLSSAFWRFPRFSRECLFECRERKFDKSEFRVRFGLIPGA